MTYDGKDHGMVMISREQQGEWRIIEASLFLFIQEDTELTDRHRDQLEEIYTMIARAAGVQARKLPERTKESE